MSLAIETDPVPLALTPDGVVRVGGTRVTLDSIVAAFVAGATSEEIAQQFPSLSLADVYAVVAFYLRRREDVDAYLAERDRQRDAVRAQNEARFDPEGMRDRLMARQVAAS